MAWLLLLCAGLFEVGFTTCLRLSQGFRAPLWTALFAVSAMLSFLLLERAARGLPLGLAYAVWVGIGAAGTVVVGWLFFGETLPPLQLAFIGLIVVAIAGLRFAQG